MKIDFHSHILPGIDDGSRSVEESVAILDMMAADGVTVVAATPHFYCTQNSIDTFLKKRNDAYERLRPHLKPEHPRIILGAEVLYDHVLAGNEQLAKLALEGTDFVLFEMPYRQLSHDIIDDVEMISGSMDVKLMIAHIERYLHFTSYKELTELMSLDVIGQMNAKSLMSFSSRRNCIKLIKDGFVQVLGTDFHRTNSGHVVLGEAEKILEKKVGREFLDSVARCGKAVLEDRSVDEILRI